MHTKRTAGLVAALTLTLGATLAACGNNDTDSSTSSQVSTTQHDHADVTFATDMIQHHAQALTMVDLMKGRPLDPAVQKLAGDIRAAQTPEIQTMTQWLTQWGEDVPQTMSGHANADNMNGMSGMGHGDQSMSGMDSVPGMMSAADMKKLQQASDTAFQKMWLEMMIKHHEGAVEMAKTEVQDGQYKPAVDLAKQIIASQSKEIDTMKGLLS